MTSGITLSATHKLSRILHPVDPDPLIHEPIGPTRQKSLAPGSMLRMFNLYDVLSM
jgi:hypothetical protein